MPTLPRFNTSSRQADGGNGGGRGGGLVLRKSWASVKSFSIWTFLLAALNVVNVIVFALCVHKLSRIDNGPENVAERHLVANARLWRVCAIFSSVVTALAATMWFLRSMFNSGVPRKPTFLVALVLACVCFCVAVLSLPVYVVFSNFWGEYCSMVCLVLLPILVFVMALGVRKEAYMLRPR